VADHPERAGRQGCRVGAFLHNLTFRPFVGFDNYATVVVDPAFQKVFANSIIFVLANVIGQVGIGLTLARLFAQPFPGAPFMRGLLLAS
jgi:multiple sugar transport system permease protein